MSEVKKLALGILLVAVGLGMLLSSSGFLPIIGALLGVVGAYLIIRALISGKI